MSNLSNVPEDLKFSFLIPTMNNLSLLRPCLESIIQLEQNTEILVYINGSNDGTKGYCQELSARFDNFSFIFSDQNDGFGPALNSLISEAEGDFLVFLNDDTIIPPHFLTSMYLSLNKANSEHPDLNISAAGPVSNNVGGNQLIEQEDYSKNQFPQVAAEFFSKNKFEYNITQFLSGFCFMLESSVIDKIGDFDESFEFGGFEDNDFCLRIINSGIHMIISIGTFIHHTGQVTLNKIGAYKNNAYLSNNIKYIEKYDINQDQKLFVSLRVKNGKEYIDDWLENVSSFADGLLVVFNDSDDYTRKRVLDSDLPVHFTDYNESFDEARDRQKLLDMAYEHNADWVLSLDIDEIMEDTFTSEVAQKLMNPVNPDINFYLFNIINFYDEHNNYMTHGPWGEMAGSRMYRVMKNQHIAVFGKKGLHCSHCPLFSPVNSLQLRHRLLHYGYNTQYKRRSKYEHYSSIDESPDKTLVGPQGYDHLVSDKVNLSKYKTDNQISLCILYSGEWKDLFTLLYQSYHIFDEINIIITEDDDFVHWIGDLFDCNLFYHDFYESFSEVRNYALTVCNYEWIMFLDPDEYIIQDQLKFIPRLLESDSDAFLFIVYNYQPDGEVLLSDNVRLFRNYDDIYYKHKVHETISESLDKSDYVTNQSGIIIHHNGFMISDKDKKDKSLFYKKLLEAEIEEDPDYAANYFHLAFHYFDLEKEKQGLKLLKKCLDIDPDSFLASKELALRYFYKSMEYMERSLDSIPEGHYYTEWMERFFNSMLKTSETDFIRE